jgi:hypothetical protein
MNPVQAPGGEPARNTGWGEAGPGELAGRDDTVVPRSDARNAGVGA